MTNEEKLREVFPRTIFIRKIEENRTVALMCSDEWLKSEYKTENREDVLTCSTNKNDLAVDCIIRDSAIKALDYDIKYFEFKSGVSKHMDEITKLLNTIYEIQVNNIKALPSVAPQESRWIPIVRRTPTDEEKAEYLAQNVEDLFCINVFENEMPLDGQEVLVSVGGRVSEDVFDEDFYNFENNDIENVDAWMPLPESYKGKSEDKYE